MRQPVGFLTSFALRTASLLLLLSPLRALSQETPWAPPEATFTVKGSTITASDGGKSQNDHYLLSSQDLRACVLDFDIIRVSERKPRERALLVFNVDFADRKNRNSIFLAPQTFPVGRPAHCRFVVLGDRAELYCDGARAGGSIVPSGKPKCPGRVGFLHYYDYDFRYENVKLVPLEGSGLPKVSDLKAELLKTGAVRLTWSVPELYQNLLSFRIYRSGAAIGECNASSYLDIRTKVKQIYEYRVCAVGSDNSTGSTSDPMTIEIAKVEPPSPPMEFRAIERLDGSARLFWKLSSDSRAESMDLFSSEKSLALADLKVAQPVAADLPPADGARLVPPSEARFFAIRVNDPDGANPAFVCKESEPTAPPVRAEAAFPAKHPYLQFTTEDIRAARQKIAKEEWAQRAYKGMLSSADAACKQGFTMPPVNDAKHRSITPLLHRVGLTYALSGDEKHAAFVKGVLLAYADIYLKLPVQNYRSRVNQYSLMEATWYEPLILAYDYINESPNLTAQEKAHIENDLLRPACALFKVDDYAHDPRGSDLHFKCYNFQAWFIGCTGLTGLCLRDPDLLEYAIDGPYGFKHLVTHDIRDDGLFWERSLGYHQFVLHALQPFLEAAYHCNFDLYHLQVPDNILKDQENIANYVVDGDNGPKSIKLLYDGPFYFTFPDLSYPVYADSSRGPLAPSDFYRIAWLRYRDPKYAWLLNQQPPPHQAQWKGPQDASAKVWLAWDDANLYVFADVKDDIVRNTHTDPTRWWQGDGLWLAFNFADNPEKVYDFIYFIDPGDFGKAKPVLALFNRYTAANNTAGAGKLKVQKTPDGYEARAIIPLAEIAPKAGERRPALRPREGMKITFDACLYDGDLTTGESVKEKMLGWSSAVDRYDTNEGGVLFFEGARAAPVDSSGKPVIVAPKIAKPLTLDGRAEDWKASPMPVVIDNPKHIMYDNPPAPPGQSLFYEPPSPNEGHFEIGTGCFASNGVAMNGSTLFPSSGFAILREGERDKDATCVALSYGPHGGGHGHSDMLSIVVYAFGKHLIPDFGSCPYESKEKGQWTAQTVSHNTVVVDETSQYPTGNRDVTWPCDSAEKQAKGTLDYFYAGPLLKVVRARSTAVYEGVETVRTLALYEGHIFDIYDVSSTQEHTYDYVLHCDGEIDKLATAGSRAALRFEPRASLGSRCGYQWFNNVRSAFTDGWFGSVLHNSSDSMDLAVFGGPGTEAILADGITNSVDKRMPTLIVRRKARDTSFVAVMTPRRPISILGAPRIEMAGDRTFNIERYPHAAKHGPDEGLFLPKAAGEIAFGRFSCCALAAAYRCDGTTAELVKATRCTLGGLRAEFSAPTSLYIAASPNACEIITGLDADSRIMLKGVPVERARVEEAGAVGRKAIAASVSGNVLSFEVKPLMRYELRW